ncbi:MAG: AAA family ATPase [Deltaproteobacteria bacterium]|nr:AAA family ATPase [Deltaproteobacteria bacterium]
MGQDEIRVATVLFADVVDFTALTSQLELETIKSLMDRLFERVYRVVVQHGGVIDKYIGDCAMALFGAPVAYGEDATRAVRAALALQRQVGQLRRELISEGLPALSVRVGLNTGPLIAGAVGAGPQRRYTVMGDTVNTAESLQQRAPVGGVLIGEATHRRVRGMFEVRRHAPREYLVLSERYGESGLRPPELFGTAVEMVGRDDELARLRAVIDRVTSSNVSETVVVFGGAGVGKTRLASELVTTLQREGARLLPVYLCADQALRDTPFAVASNALRRRLEMGAELTAPSIATRWRRLIESFGGNVSRGQLANLRRLFASGRAVEATSSDRQRFHQAVRGCFVELARQVSTSMRLVVLVDDFQWCDAQTAELLDGVIEELADHGITLVLLGRRDELPHDRLAIIERATETIGLEPLSTAATQQLLCAIVGPVLAARLRSLAAQTAGNPYFIEEFLRSLEDRGTLVRRVSGWYLGDVPEDLGVPPGLESVTQTRIDNLSASQRTLLRAAATIGAHFWESALRLLVPDYTGDDLTVLVRRSLIVPVRESTVPGEREYRFLHETTREVAYRMTPKPARQQMHGAVAHWLESQDLRSWEAEALIAGHHADAGNARRAVDLFERACQKAYERSAYDAALLYARRALELVDDDELTFRLVARRERIYNALGRWREQLADAERMMELASDHQSRVEAHLRMGRAQLNLGQQREARESFAHARQLAADLGDAEGTARSLRWLAMYHFNRSDHFEALPLFKDALAVADSGGLESLVAELAYELGVTVGTIGDYVQALDVSGRALQMFRQQDNRYQEAFCLGNIGCFHIYLGEYVEGIAVLEQAVALGREMRIPLAEGSALANLGNGYRCMGDVEQAVAYEREAGRIARRLEDVRLEADALLYAALAELTTDEQDAGRQKARQALELAVAWDIAGTRAAAAMAVARADLHAGQYDAAYAQSREAVDLLDQLGSVEGFEAEIRLTHAEVCLASNRIGEAQEVLARAREEIEQRSLSIESTVRRACFLGKVLANKRILELAAEQGV